MFFEYSKLVLLYKIGELLWLAWHEWFSGKGKEWKNYSSMYMYSFVVAGVISETPYL